MNCTENFLWTGTDQDHTYQDIPWQIVGGTLAIEVAASDTILNLEAECNRKHQELLEHAVQGNQEAKK